MYLNVSSVSLWPSLAITGTNFQHIGIIIPTHRKYYVLAHENMDAIITSGVEDPLIEGLPFKPPSNTANYVLETRQVTYQAESGNRFDPVSSRVIRFRLADHGFLEASSVNLVLTLQNTETHQLRLLVRQLACFDEQGYLPPVSSSRIGSNLPPKAALRID